MQGRKQSLMTDDLIPTAEQERLREREELGALEACMGQVEVAFACINELDWQVTKSKHVISKYKDLVVKMQLQLNGKDRKIEELKANKQKYKD